MAKNSNPGLDLYWKNKNYGGSVLNPISNGKKPNNLLHDIIHTKNNPKQCKYL